MKLSSVLTLCSGLINAGIAGMFYYFAVISYLENWLQIAGWQLLMGVVFTVVSGGSFLGSRHSGKTRSVFGDVALVMVTLAELLFSILLLFFAFAAGDLSLLEYGIPFMAASIFLLAGRILRWRETKVSRIPERELESHA